MFLAILLFWMVYSPRFGTFGDMTSMVSILLAIIALAKGAIEPQAVKQIRNVLLCLFFSLFSYSILNFFWNSPHELSFILRYLRVIIQFIGAYSIVRLYYCKYGDEMGEKFLMHLFWIITANAALMMLMYLFEPVRDIIWNIVDLEYDKRRTKRIGGLTGALDTLSVIQAFAIILIPYFINKYKGIKLLWYSLAIVLVLFSILISGRTGIVLLILFLPVIAVFTKVKVGRILFLLIMTGFIMLLGSLFINPGEDVTYRFKGQIERLTSFLTSSEEGGQGLEEGATAKLLEDYKNGWPTTATQFIFGNSRSGRTDDNRIPADPGYILDVHGIGLIGLFLTSLFYAICIRQAVKCYPYNKFIAMASLIYALEAVMVQGKVVFFLARTGFTISTALLLLTVYYQHIYSSIENYTYDEIDLSNHNSKEAWQ